MSRKHKSILNMNEFSNIRNEIVAYQEQRRNVWINMYILYSAVFVLGLELSCYMFLVTYLIILPFQAAINNLEWNVSRLSAYIRIFYEEKDESLNWESMNVNYEAYRKYLSRMEGKLSAWIRNTSAAQLGFLSTLFFIGNLIYEKHLDNFGIIEFFLILISVILFLAALMLSLDCKKSYTDELEYITRKYKEYVDNR